MTEKQQEYFRISMVWYGIAEQRKEQAKKERNIALRAELLEKAQEAAKKGQQFELKAKNDENPL